MALQRELKKKRPFESPEQEASRGTEPAEVMLFDLP